MQRNPIASRLAQAALLIGLAPPPMPVLAFDAATLEGIGRFGTGDTRAGGMNNLGQVVGTAVSASGAQSAFLYGSGTLIDLSPSFVGDQSGAAGINDAGQIVGWSRLSVINLQSGFVMTSAGVNYLSFPGDATSMVAIDNSGHMVGNLSLPSGVTAALYAYVPPTKEANVSFVNGTSMSAVYNGTFVGYSQSLGGWVGADVFSFPIVTNAAVSLTLLPRGLNQQTVVGSTTGGLAFRVDGGVVSYLPGSSAQAIGINDAGLIVGQANTASGTHAWIWGSGVGYDLNSLAPAGWVLNTAVAVNNGSQIAGTGTHDGHSEAFLLSMRPTWKGGNGNWTTGSRWGYGGLASLGLTPAATEDAVIGAGLSATVAVGADVTARSVSLTTVAGQLATLALAGGSVTTTAGVQVGANAVLTGSGRIGGDTTLLAGGTLALQAGDSLQFTGGSFTNTGQVRMLGLASTSAQFTAAGSALNDSGARWNAQNATLDFRGGLVNRGLLSFASGSSTVFGTVVNAAGGQVIVSGGSNTTFYDTVEVQQDAELRVSAGSTATFFGVVLQRTGSLFTGTGISFYEGGLSVGDSPGFGMNAGNVTLGAGNVYTAEIGGSTACTAACASDEALKNHGYDRYVVAGRLQLGGVLKLLSWNGYVLQAGQSLALFDAGAVSGSFSDVDSSGLLLDAGTQLDLTKLYTDGVIGISAVPESGTCSMMLAGLSALGLLRRRQRARGRHARVE